MAARLTPLSRIIIILIILAGLGFGIKYLLDNTELGEQLMSKSEQQSNDITKKEVARPSSSSDADVLKVQVFTWGGYAPGIYFNEGFESSKKSRFYKDYGLLVEFKLIDDFDASRQAWIADEVHLHGNEVSAMATEMERLGPHDPRVLMQVDWSRGGDAIIGRRGIKSINDLKGKTVAVTPSTPSQTFLIFALESAGMGLQDVKVLEVPSAPDAATAFKSGKVDAAVVWSPDDIIATRDVPGSTILQSTKDASHIVADVMVVKQDYADKNADKLAKFYEGWMRGAAEINASEANLDKAARILSKGMSLPTEDAKGMIQTTRLTTHGDNVNFFGMNPAYKGVTGESLYTKMGDAFEKLGFAPSSRPSWRTMSYSRGVSAADLTGPTHAAEKQKSFKPATKSDEKKVALSTKPISISYPTGSAVLGENAKTLIDLQFADVARAYGNARIRIEGNTDITGDHARNVALSKKRAQSVADYLAATYNMDASRFIIIGHGPDNPVKGCETSRSKECLAKNRRTDFQLLAE